MGLASIEAYNIKDNLIFDNWFMENLWGDLRDWRMESRLTTRIIFD